MADQQYKVLAEEEDLIVVTKRKEPLRIEIDTDRLGINDVLFLMNLRGDKLGDEDVLQKFLPVIERCLVGMEIKDLPLRALQTVFRTVVGGLEEVGAKTKNSNGASQQASGQPVTVAQ